MNQKKILYIITLILVISGVFLLTKGSVHRNYLYQYVYSPLAADASEHGIFIEHPSEMEPNKTYEVKLISDFTLSPKDLENKDAFPTDFEVELNIPGIDIGNGEVRKLSHDFTYKMVKWNIHPKEVGKYIGSINFLNLDSLNYQSVHVIKNNENYFYEDGRNSISISLEVNDSFWSWENLGKFSLALGVIVMIINFFKKEK